MRQHKLAAPHRRPRQERADARHGPEARPRRQRSMPTRRRPSRAPTSPSSARRSAPTPPSVQRSAPISSRASTLTDVGSVKQAVIRDLGPHVPEHVHFIPGHPIAGTEHSGPESGFAELFDGRWCILTPPAGADETAVDKLAEFWRALRQHGGDHGGRPSRPGAGHHLATCRTSSPTASSAPRPTWRRRRRAR